MDDRDGIKVKRMEALYQDVHFLRSDLTKAVDNLTHAVTALTASIDVHKNSQERIVESFKGTIPIKVVILLIMIVAGAFGGKTIIDSVADSKIIKTIQ